MSWTHDLCSGPYVSDCITFADDVDNLRLYQWCQPCLFKLSALLMERRRDAREPYAEVNSMLDIGLTSLRDAWEPLADKESPSDIECAVRNFLDDAKKYGLRYVGEKGEIVASEHRPRVHRLVNPEQCADILRRIVIAWDADDSENLFAELADARTLLGVVVARKSEQIEEAG